MQRQRPSAPLPQVYSESGVQLLMFLAVSFLMGLRTLDVYYEAVRSVCFLIGRSSARGFLGAAPLFPPPAPAAAARGGAVPREPGGGMQRRVRGHPAPPPALLPRPQVRRRRGKAIEGAAMGCGSCNCDVPVNPGNPDNPENCETLQSLCVGHAKYFCS